MFNLNMSNVEASAGFAPLPKGDQPFIVKKLEVKPTKQNNGHFINLQAEVLDGQYKGRQVFTCFNIDNPNAEAVRIGLAELKAYLVAVLGEEQANQVTGVEPILQTMGASFIGYVTVKDGDNKISGFKPFASAEQQQTVGSFGSVPANQPAQQQFNQPQAGGGMPWQQQ